MPNIIFAVTNKDKNGFCDVLYDDMTDNILSVGINKLFENVKKSNPESRYLMVGRSCFVCVDNIFMICPSRRELILAGNSLEKQHININEKAKCSDDLLRELRRNIL
ncbi:MAG: hypothetical protein II554_07090 [Bacteroidales bacterium]|nr:hypothetical protein [Bacteroidales bacterium]